MHIELERIEELTGEQLRRLPLKKDEDGDEQDTVYSPDGLEQLESDDEISAAECWFMQGYLDG